MAGQRPLESPVGVRIPAPQQMIFKSAPYIFLFTLLISPLSAKQDPNQRRITLTVHSIALEGNILGESPNRNVTVYLPFGYDDSDERRYPVLYLLHGYNADYYLWTVGRFFLGKGWSITSVADSLIEAGEIEPMIIVMPSVLTKYGGSWYVNSEIMGNWDDFIAIDLVHEIDATFKTIDNSTSRGIAGHSMGAFGAVWLGMEHPDVFGSVYGMSTSRLDFETDMLKDLEKSMLEASLITDPDLFRTLGFSTQLAISLGAAFSPDPLNLPFFVDLPIVYENGKNKLLDDVWQKWLNYSVATDEYLTGYEERKGKQLLSFDIGSADKWLESNKSFSSELSRRNIDHNFQVYDGDHLNKISYRLTNIVMPFFSESFSQQKTNLEGLFNSKYSLTYLGAVVLLIFLLIRRLFRRFNIPEQNKYSD